MHELHPLSGRKIAIRKPLPLIIRAAPDCARFSLRIDPAELARASQAFELTLPATIGKAVAADGRMAVCLGPDEWYLTAPSTAQQAMESAFATLYGVVPHSLVDVGHREVGIEIEGADAALALQSAIPFDIEAMPRDTGCRTLFDKAQIVLVRETEQRFRMEVWRSFASHAWELLAAASREIELGI